MENIFYVSPSLQGFKRVTAFISKQNSVTQKHLLSYKTTCVCPMRSHVFTRLKIWASYKLYRLRAERRRAACLRSPLHFIYTSIEMRQNACHGPHVKSIQTTNFVLTRKRFLPGNRKMHRLLHNLSKRSYYELAIHEVVSIEENSSKR